ARVEYQVRLSSDKSGAANVRMNLAFNNRNVSLEKTADDAFLTPHFAFAQFAVGEQTSQFRTRAGTTRRTVVSFSRTQHEVTTIDAVDVGSSKKLDVIDLVAIVAGDAVARQRVANARGEISQ